MLIEQTFILTEHAKVKSSSARYISALMFGFQLILMPGFEEIMNESINECRFLNFFKARHYFDKLPQDIVD